MIAYNAFVNAEEHCMRFLCKMSHEIWKKKQIFVGTTNARKFYDFRQNFIVDWRTSTNRHMLCTISFRAYIYIWDLLFILPQLIQAFSKYPITLNWFYDWFSVYLPRLYFLDYSEQWHIMTTTTSTMSAVDAFFVSFSLLHHRSFLFRILIVYSS